MVDGCMPFAIGSQGFGGGSAAEETTSRFNNGRGLHPADAAADVLSWCDHLWGSVAFPRKLSEVMKKLDTLDVDFLKFPCLWL